VEEVMKKILKNILMGVAKFTIATLVIVFISLLIFRGISVAQAQGFSQCRTVRGNIIIVEGPVCPAGTIWVGIG
jgi:hypothetical protein